MKQNSLSSLNLTQKIQKKRKNSKDLTLKQLMQ